MLHFRAISLAWRTPDADSRLRTTKPNTSLPEKAFSLATRGCGRLQRRAHTDISTADFSGKSEVGARAASSYGPKRHESLPDPLDRRSDRRERPSPVWMPRPLPELKRCRIAAGVTQEELAGRARVARETLCKIERGRPATRETVRRLAAALPVPPGVLAGTVTGTRCERAHDKSGAPDRGSVPRATQRYQSSGLTAHGAGDGRDAPRTALPSIAIGSSGTGAASWGSSQARNAASKATTSSPFSTRCRVLTQGVRRLNPKVAQHQASCARPHSASASRLLQPHSIPQHTNASTAGRACRRPAARR